MALRTPLSVTPHLYMGDSTGRPLDKGVVYFGEQDKDPEFYPINLFSDDALTKPLAQPVHTKGGYLYDKGDMVEPHAKEIIYSVKVLDSYGRKVFYKGAMMRNSWNDDVIEQINTAVIGSADAARQVAIDITNDAINNTAIEGGVLADTFVVVDGSLSQRTINKGLESIADLSTIKNPKNGLRVYVKSYHAGKGVGGGYFTYDSSKLGVNDGGVIINGWVRVIEGNPTIQQFGVIDGADCTESLLNAAKWSRANKRYVLDKTGGTFKFSETLDFTKSGAGFVGAGTSNTIMLWQGTEGKTPIKVDAGGCHNQATVSNARQFKWGEVVTSGDNAAIVRSFPWSDKLELQVVKGSFKSGDTITGKKSNATDTIVLYSGPASGTSLVDIKIKGFRLLADINQNYDAYSRPRAWNQSVGIYINGARNHSQIGDIHIEGFEFGLYSKYNWMCEYTDTIYAISCKRSITFDTETNNIKLGMMSVRRSGNINDLTDGHSVSFIASYSINTTQPIDIETSNSDGIVIEGCRGMNLLGGDIEGNDSSRYKVIVKGLDGADYANNKIAWSRAITISGFRFSKSLGILFRDGCRKITVGGNEFAYRDDVSQSVNSAIHRDSSAEFIKDICILNTNDFFGDSSLQTQLPSSMLIPASEYEVRNRPESIAETTIDTTDVNRLIPIDYLSSNVIVERVEFIQQNNLSGTAIIDVGNNKVPDSIVSSYTFNPVDTTSYVLGYQQATKVASSVNVSKGAIHIRIRSGSTLSAGKIKVKVVYRLQR